MLKAPKIDATSDCSEALRATANILVQRANDLAIAPAKVRARQLARIVLRAAPGFGAPELRDPEVLNALRAEDIGLAVFRKELSAARKELVKKPARLPMNRKQVNHTQIADKPVRNHENGSSNVKMTERSLL